MIVFIESLGRNSTDPNNYFSVVEVVYKENDKALDSYIKLKSEFNPFFRIISKAGVIVRCISLSNVTSAVISGSLRVGLMCSTLMMSLGR